MGVLGAKAIRLKELQDLGFKVPQFICISDIKDIKELNCEKYAVRSSAQVEDSAEKSFAGQFKTILDVSPEDLEKAAKEVMKDSESVIIQEFINPDMSGVTFTRNPLGGREMVIEYHKGVGEELVSGKIKPDKLSLYWNQDSDKFPIELFKKIEKHYKFPQDIEWCIKDGEFFFLQTRPITTIDKTEHTKSLYLDKILPKDKFYFEKTEISEIAPRPTQITKDLLKKIYAASGPIQKAYAKHGITYESHSILKIIGNELFVDREKELQTLLPAYSFTDSLKPKLSRLKGLFRTLRNSYKLQRISLKNYRELAANLKGVIEEKGAPKDLSEFLKKFMEDYELVFEVNLLTSLAFKKLETALQKDKDKIAEILSMDPEEDFTAKIDPGGLKGNALEVSDESNFLLNKNEEKPDDSWWKYLPGMRKKLLEKPVKYALIYNDLRELSRWLVVKNINILRDLLFDLAEDFQDKKKIYFASLEGEISEKECTERQEEYEKYLAFEFPKILFHKPIELEEELISVSPGKAEGVLVADVKDSSGKKILYTKNLEPSLTAYFDQIEGIVSERGSLLSHLAIIAREEKIPVIVNFSLGDIKLGDKIKIINNQIKNGN